MIILSKINPLQPRQHFSKIPSDHSAAYLERGLFAWIPFSVIRQAIAKRRTGRVQIPGKYLPPDKRSNRIFEPFLTSLLAAKTAGVLPWEQ